MKITEIRTTVMWAGLRNWVVVKVLTDSDIYGWGEATLEGKEETVCQAVKQLGQTLIGEDPLATEHHWQVIFRHSFWRGGVVLNSALAGLDQALWDIRGKAWGVPVYKLLGGATRNRLRLYTHVGIYQPAQMVEDAQRDVADGFTAMKTGAWAGDSLLPEHERVAAFSERISLLRQTVGPTVDIMVDDHGRGRATSAVRLISALQPYRLFFFEEPCQPEDLDALAQVRAANLSTDLATGERLYSKWDFLPLLERRVIDVIQPDLCHAGGITECKKIAALAEAYNVQVAPHNPQGPLATAAAAHLGLAIPNFLILEYVRQEPYRDQFMRTAWSVEDGHLIVPDLPGLGVEVNEEVIAANPYRSRSGKSTAFAADGRVVDV